VNYHFGGKTGLLSAVVAAVSDKMLGRIEDAIAAGGTFEERVRALTLGIVAAINAAPYAPRLIVEQILFADAPVIEEFVERFARPNFAAIVALLDDGLRSGEMRPVDPRFMTASMIGSCVYFFLSAPLLRQLFDLDELDTKLTEDFAAHTAELILHGVATRQGAPA
jgi:AcrR family transcriptional regulator